MLSHHSYALCIIHTIQDELTFTSIFKLEKVLHTQTTAYPIDDDLQQSMKNQILLLGTVCSR